MAATGTRSGTVQGSEGCRVVPTVAVTVRPTTFPCIKDIALGVWRRSSRVGLAEPTAPAITTIVRPVASVSEEPKALTAQRCRFGPRAGAMVTAGTAVGRPRFAGKTPVPGVLAVPRGTAAKPVRPPIAAVARS